jgi:hypothetical protein
VISATDVSRGRTLPDAISGRAVTISRLGVPIRRLGSLDQLARRFDDSNTRSKRLETFSKQSSRYTWKKFIMVHHPENC